MSDEQELRDYAAKLQRRTTRFNKFAAVCSVFFTGAGFLVWFALEVAAEWLW